MNFINWLPSIITIFALPFLSVICASEVTSKRLIHANQEPENWLTYSGTYEAWRYSGLDQISRENIKKLIPVWSFQTGVIDGGLQATPIGKIKLLFTETIDKKYR